jgi:hypothetical protein
LVLAALTGSGPSQFLDDLRGTWACGDATWTIAAAPGNSTWASVTYGAANHIGGTAYVGWVPQLQRFIYRDFHNDGAIAELTSPAPVDNTWTWTGTYYPAGGQADSGGHITWAYKAPNTLIRHFGKVQNGTYTELGSDQCSRNAPSP